MKNKVLKINWCSTKSGKIINHKMSRNYCQATCNVIVKN